MNRIFMQATVLWYMGTFTFARTALNFFFARADIFEAMRLTNCVYIIVFTLLGLNSSAQPSQNLQFIHFSEEHRLPLIDYNSILQDQKGYIWFGLSDKGLIRYDGYSFRMFEQDPF